MAMVSRFEDLQAWQEARKLVNMVYKLTSSGGLAKDDGVRDQIQRASVSVTEAQFKEHYEQARITKALIGGLKHSLANRT